MKSGIHSQENRSGQFFLGLVVILVFALLFATANCGGTLNTQFQSSPPRGTASVSVSDPPSCKVPNGSFKSVFITVRSIQAHISSSATDSTAGWVELAPQLANLPVQIDLLATPQGGCTLAQLGSNVSLPAGDYQQIRLLLLSNNPSPTEPVPANNACGAAGFNCVVLSDDSVHVLNLSSQSNTGLKIPPGQIVGGPIRIAASQHTDINIDFNACASILRQGNGQFRLKPTLTAGQVSQVNTGISGQVVNSVTLQPIAGGKVVVAIEQPDSTGVERIVMQASPDANGNFNFCPLPTGTYDIVAVAVDGTGAAYSATVLLNVPSGTLAGKIPLVAQSGSPNTTANIQGLITSSAGNSGTAVDAAMSAFQPIQLAGGGTRLVTIPLQGASTALVSTSATPTGVVCPAGTFCAQYSLIVPSGNPSIGTFASAGTVFSAPVAGDVNFQVEARAFAPSSGGTPICSSPRLITDKDTLDQPLKVAAGATVTAKQLDFTGCT